jgi:hypothetical protein
MSVLVDARNAVRTFADGVRALFRELYKTPPGC